MTVPQVKSLDPPGESRQFPNAFDAVVSTAGRPIGRAELRPGGRWSNHVRPLAGTASCQARHLSHLSQLVTGTLHVETDDGSHTELIAGDAFEVLPGHDARVVGNASCHLLDGSPAAGPDASPQPDTTAADVSA